ncbi:MAG TPA: histidine phosphatase family protein [Pyrinomonadaceae bacterium]
MSLKIFFLRHGQTELSREDTFCGSGLDPELTSEGLKMAQAFAEAYKETKWQAIFTSVLRRTITTAGPLLDLIQANSRPRSELNEIAYGQWEGLTKETVNQKFHDDYIKWLADPAWHSPTGGETAVAMAQRALKLMGEISEEFADGNVLVVSHKATIRVILCGLLGIDVGRFRYRIVCPVGSVSIIEFNAEGPLLHALADRSHFSDDLLNLPGT